MRRSKWAPVKRSSLGVRIVCRFLVILQCSFALFVAGYPVALWGFRFALDCVSEVATRTLSAQGPRYSEVLELDRKIRDFQIRGNTLDVLGQQSGAGPSDMPLSSSMARFMLNHTRETRTSQKSQIIRD